ncbi:uncharacterized protein BYT42DRAFT_536745 [Radiomyces spectabilis]|uniref:uncharacterized protein n=1 Tax=Radiomyces spectabilis TaxID=64574 RepID=UPI002220F20C|nr:uncharacterized protein BYT42DRAFT_536745 [Radiomyces spectabilis]KAI8373097.1 hypothetical protein BYT42DRAFT_536745 [Radiomyces spectabilis]
MPSFLQTAILALTAVSMAHAAIVIKTPWEETTWRANQPANLAWVSNATDFGTVCDIQLLTGSDAHAHVIANLTAADKPIPCSVNQYTTSPLQTYDTGDYFVRIGQAAKDNWSYSGTFRYIGKGAFPMGANSTMGSSAGSTTSANPSTKTAASSVTSQANASTPKASSLSEVSSDGASTADAASESSAEDL